MDAKQSTKATASTQAQEKEHTSTRTFSDRHGDPDPQPDRDQLHCVADCLEQEPAIDYEQKKLVDCEGTIHVHESVVPAGDRLSICGQWNENLCPRHQEIAHLWHLIRQQFVRREMPEQAPSIIGPGCSASSIRSPEIKPRVFKMEERDERIGRVGSHASQIAQQSETRDAVDWVLWWENERGGQQGRLACVASDAGTYVVEAEACEHRQVCVVLRLARQAMWRNCNNTDQRFMAATSTFGTENEASATEDAIEASRNVLTLMAARAPKCLCEFKIWACSLFRCFVVSFCCFFLIVYWLLFVVCCLCVLQFVCVWLFGLFGWLVVLFFLLFCCVWWVVEIVWCVVGGGNCVLCVVCCVLRVVCGVWCVLCGVFCVLCSVFCVLWCVVWFVLCVLWCVVLFCWWCLLCVVVLVNCCLLFIVRCFVWCFRSGWEVGREQWEGIGCCFVLLFVCLCVCVFVCLCVCVVVRCSLFVVCWSLVVGYWLLVAGCWLLVVGGRTITDCERHNISGLGRWMTWVIWVLTLWDGLKQSMCDDGLCTLCLLVSRDWLCSVDDDVCARRPTLVRTFAFVSDCALSELLASEIRDAMNWCAYTADVFRMRSI